ncbi:MAG TPA: hypothetical protein VF725_01535 [Ktedonobacterales bacterium]
MATGRAPDDDDFQVSALSPRAPRVWRLWEKRTRLLLVFALVVVAVTGAVVGVTLRNRAAPATLSACPAALTARILSELPGLSITAYADSTMVTISEQTALSAVNQQMEPDLQAATCLVARAMRIETGQFPLLSEEHVWAFAYHIPARRGAPAGTFNAPFDMWGFVDATNGDFISGGSALTPQ